MISKTSICQDCRLREGPQNIISNPGEWRHLSKKKVAQVSWEQAVPIEVIAVYKVQGDVDPVQVQQRASSGLAKLKATCRC